MKTKPFVIIQLRSEDEAADNELEAFLNFGQLSREEIVRIHAEKNGIPDLYLDDYSGIIVGGSPFMVGDPEEKKSAIQKKVEADFQRLFTNIIEKDFPFLGACSGIGLLGNHCGAHVSGKYKEDVGGVDATLTAEGKKDPLLKDLPETFRVLVGHKEACDAAPIDATLLASSPTCPVQMFRVKQNVYATQFHPEADAKGFTVRIHIYKHHGYFPPEEAQSLIEAVEKEDTPIPKEILRRFVQKYRMPAE